ncbi:MAG: L-threonylcarbamoyladenylate synthase [Mariprofundaceae bacterium]|nr:L-threonylcarbamoyladenylate synthase [Mariprofundaceae bacterium]
MATTFEHLRMHPDRPQIRQIRRAAEMLQKGAFAVVPTETTYAIMMLPEALEAQTAVRKLRKLDQKHLWSLVVSDLSQAAQYVNMDNQAHRILKRCLPGPYTFILPASSTLPKRVFGKRRDIGIRIPSHPICSMLLDELRQPLLATSMQLPDQDVWMDPDDMVEQLKHMHAVVMDAGWGGMMPTTIVDLCDGEAAVLRQGLGDWPYPS